MCLDHEELLREASYWASVSLAEELLRRRIVDRTEYKQICAMLLETFAPVFGALLAPETWDEPWEGGDGCAC